MTGADESAKDPMPGAERQRRRRERLAAAGYREITVAVPPETKEHLLAFADVLRSSVAAGAEPVIHVSPAIPAKVLAELQARANSVVAGLLAQTAEILCHAPPEVLVRFKNRLELTRGDIAVSRRKEAE